VSHLHPPTETAALVSRHHRATAPIIHPQEILVAIERERPRAGRANAWLADHVVALAGTMVFFHALWLLIGGWALWQSGFAGNHGFDPFPYAFLFFILGGIMQSLFVPTMLTASNRAAARDRIKDEADHRAWSHLYEVNEEQLRLLRELQARLEAAQPGGARGAAP
jgi:uncharacterized membrane protein